MSERTDTLMRDRLARQRTELANERTLLSYIRTALGFFAVGIPAVWWLEGVVIQTLGVVSLFMGAVFLAVGARRFFTIKAGIDQSPD
jgi:putative membrane protein